MLNNVWGCSSNAITIYGKITGPGMLTQPCWNGGRVIVDNPDNDYAGGRALQIERL